MREQTPVDALLGEIARDYQYCAPDTGLERPSVGVVEALKAVPRHRFVPIALADKAYLNCALPIEEGQTISQPFIVALMTDLLQLKAGSRVLDVGTGCGYQAAVLAQLASEVYSVEIVPALHASARHRLAELGYANIRLLQGNGCDGWQAHAPYDGILVAAAADHVPPALLEQLARGGRMVLPLVTVPGQEMLTLIEKDAEGRLSTRAILPVRFVPLLDPAREPPF